jgi:hypothetical protein
MTRGSPAESATPNHISYFHTIANRLSRANKPINVINFPELHFEHLGDDFVHVGG